ncbi:hypothetical protein G9464_04080 [Halostella sp. JP-L12]|uniref:PPC domain-containing protein n=1 Tax=Halostella TaxID=1843185 RepID=UPI000EF851CA|nr:MULTISPECIES: PPC domain-containing protein [Halostella]NHN46774.1 hypothetical protein [Halostella sp. JP-L12]
MTIENERRRRILQAGAAAFVSGLAGCSSYLEDDGGALSSGNGTTGTETIEREEIELPVEGEAEWIGYGETASSRVTESAPSDPAYDGRYEPWTFTGREGDVVTVTMESDPGDPYLYLLDEDGTVLEENDDGGSSELDAQIAGYELPEDGTYVVLAASYGDEVDFPYELGVREGVEGEKIDLRSIEVGETATGKVDVEDPDQFEDYEGFHEPVSFEVASDQAVTIEMSSDEADPVFGVADSTGAVVASDDDGGDGLDSRLVAFPASADEEYTIVATSYGGSVGFEYELSVQEADASDGRDLRSIEIGETATGEIDHGDPESDRFNGYFEPVSLRADGGETVSIEMTAADGDTYLYLLDPAGSVIAQDDDGAGSLNSRIEYAELSDAGEYTVVAGGFQTNGFFEYELSVQEAQVDGRTDLRSIEIGETATGEIDPADPESDRFNGYFEPVSLRADGGETVSIEMTAADGDTYLYLLDPAGSVIAQDDDGGSGLNSRIEYAELADAGEYTVIAGGFRSDGFFEYELSVQEAQGSGGGGADLRSIRIGETASGEIDRDDPRSDRFNGYFEPVSLRADGGETVTIEMNSADGDTYLYLLGPDGNVIAENDDYGGSLNSQISGVTLDDGGEYFIIAGGFRTNGFFEYELSVAEQ